LVPLHAVPWAAVLLISSFQDVECIGAVASGRPSLRETFLGPQGSGSVAIGEQSCQPVLFAVALGRGDTDLLIRHEAGYCNEMGRQECVLSA
jgi:hypothetical protein